MTSTAKDTLTLDGDLEEVNEWFYRERLTDGLPIIPPTPERVQRMIDASGRHRDDVISVIPPREGEATVEAIAANAVMAGCRPEYMPVLIAAAKALGDDVLNIRGIQATTGGPALLVILNGPIRRQLEVNCGTNVLGQGFRANATIGRAVRLMVTTIGGVYPGHYDKGTMGNPGKYSLCVGENEEANPWEPLHVEHGFDRSQSTIAIMGSTPGHHIQHHKDNDAMSILTTLASCIPVRGQTHSYVLFLCPERAADLARGGFSKQDIKDFLFKNVRYTVRHHKKLGNWSPEWNAFYPSYINLEDDDALIPATLDTDEYTIVVAGGPGGINYCYGGGGSWRGRKAQGQWGIQGRTGMGSPVIYPIEVP